MRYHLQVKDSGQTVIIHEPDCKPDVPDENEVWYFIPYVRLGKAETTAKYYGSAGCSVSGCPECKPMW